METAQLTRMCVISCHPLTTPHSRSLVNLKISVMITENKTTGHFLSGLVLLPFLFTYRTHLITDSRPPQTVISLKAPSVTPQPIPHLLAISEMLGCRFFHLKSRFTGQLETTCVTFNKATLEEQLPREEHCPQVLLSRTAQENREDGNTYHTFHISPHLPFYASSR
jgi:hypothetical protein